MIRFRLKAVLAEKEFRDGRRVTFDEVASATGIHRTTLSKLANQRGYSTTTDVLDKLCTFFCIPLSDLAEHLTEEPS
jgi:putative transcriptional regulator